MGLSIRGVLVLYMMEKTAWVRRDCVMNCGICGLSLPTQSIKLKAAIGLLYSSLLPVRLQDKLVRKLTAFHTIDKAVLKNWVNVVSINKVSLSDIWCQIMMTRSYNKKPSLGEKSSDLLILSSKKDGWVNPRCSDSLSKYTKS